MNATLSNTNVISSNLSEMLITGTNKKLNSFYIRPKSDFELELSRQSENTEYEKYLVISPNEGCYKESIIISMMKNTKFYTYFNNCYTDVIVVNGNLRSIPNGTTQDNLLTLPNNTCE